MQRSPAPPQPYIMLTVATSLTACTNTPSSSGQQLGHQLGALGRRGDRVAEEVPAAGEDRADRRGVVALEDQRLERGQRRAARPGSSTGSGAVVVRAPKRSAGSCSSKPSVPSRRRHQPVGLGAGAQAEPAAVALARGRRPRASGRSPGRSRCPSRCSASGTPSMQRPHALQNWGNSKRPRLEFLVDADHGCVPFDSGSHARRPFGHHQLTARAPGAGRPPPRPSTWPGSAPRARSDVGGRSRRCATRRRPTSSANRSARR